MNDLACLKETVKKRDDEIELLDKKLVSAKDSELDVAAQLETKISEIQMLKEQIIDLNDTIKGKDSAITSLS